MQEPGPAHATNMLITFGSASMVFPKPSEPCTKSAILSFAAPIELRVAPWETGTCGWGEVVSVGHLYFLVKPVSRFALDRTELIVSLCQTSG